MPAKKSTKKYYKKPTQSNKIARLQKQVKSIQINDKPETKFIMFNSTITPSGNINWIPRQGTSQSFALYNNITQGTGQQNRVGQAIRIKNIKINVYIPSPISQVPWKLMVFGMRDSQYDVSNSNLQNYWANVKTFNGSDIMDPVRYQQMIPLVNKVIPAAQVQADRIIRLKTLKVNRKVTYDVGSTYVTNGELFCFMCGAGTNTNSSNACGVLTTISYTDC